MYDITMPRSNTKNYKRKRTMPRMSFEQRVRGVINTVSEKKVAKFYSPDTTIGETMLVPMRLMPSVIQGTRAHGNRIGNEISLKKLTIKGFIRIPSTTSVGGDTEHLSRMFVIKQRDANADAIIVSDITVNPLFDANNLMEYQQPYIGTPNNWLQSVNADAFIVRRDIKKHYSVSGNYQGADTETPNPDSIKFFSITLTFGKGKVLNYATDTATQSADFPYFLTCAIHQPDGSETAGNPKLQYYTEADYTDV